LICADDGRAKESATWRSQYLTRRKKLTATAFRRRCRFYPAELKKRL